jgi:molecular chaperone DnaK (HSP70)
MASVAAVGLDFGGQTAVLAIAKKGGIEVVTNEASQRETPLVVGFGQNERFLGEQAFVQV